MNPIKYFRKLDRGRKTFILLSAATFALLWPRHSIQREQTFRVGYVNHREGNVSFENVETLSYRRNALQGGFIPEGTPVYELDYVHTIFELPFGQPFGAPNILQSGTSLEDLADGDIITMRLHTVKPNIMHHLHRVYELGDGTPFSFSTENAFCLRYHTLDVTKP
jgi:hypothetical protein